MLSQKYDEDMDVRTELLDNCHFPGTQSIAPDIVCVCVCYLCVRIVCVSVCAYVRVFGVC